MTQPHRSPTALGPAALDWLREVGHLLAPLPPAEREEILNGLRTHLVESISAGDDEDEALARLGSAQEVADSARQQYDHAAPNTQPHPRYLTTKRWLQIIVLALTLAAAVVLLLLPTGIEVSQSSSSSGATTETVDTVTLLQANGPFALMLLAIPLALAVTPLLCRGKAWQPASVVSAVGLGLFMIIGLVSIGPFFLPAVVLAIVAACLRAR